MISYLICILIVVFILVMFAWLVAAAELQKKACAVHLTQQSGWQTLILPFKKVSLRAAVFVRRPFHPSVTVRAADSEFDKRSCFSSWSCHRRLASNHDIHTHTKPLQILQYIRPLQITYNYSSLWCEAFYPWIIRSGHQQTPGFESDF